MKNALGDVGLLRYALGNPKSSASIIGNLLPIALGNVSLLTP